MDFHCCQDALCAILFRKICVQNILLLEITQYKDFYNLPFYYIVGICGEKCLNGGKCIQKDTCECSKGYYGPHCEYC